MSQDKEREIQLQFLEEAIEYLDTIESVLLGLAGSHIDAQKMDAVLRAAHSVKGGAGMMGFSTLSQLAHRLEDSFKVLKQQRNAILVSESLLSLLLQAVDRLRQVLEANRLGTDVDEQWMLREGNPVFEQLTGELGEPVADDATTVLGTEDGTNVAALLFETEVEGCLNRLEAVLADPQAPCLMEELSIMAQELGGLGEMLSIPAFTQLCESVIQHLETAPELIREIAQSALKAWRRSQALILVGQVSSLPTEVDALTLAQGSPTLVAADSLATLAVEEECLYEEVKSEFEIKQTQESRESAILTSTSDESPPSSIVILSPSPDREVLSSHPIVEDPEAERFSAHSENAESEGVAAFFDIKAIDESTQQPSVSDAESRPRRVASPYLITSQNYPGPANPDGEVHINDVTWPEAKTEPARHTKATESQENTVRIPVRQLDRLNDLFGELTIERNGLSLQLGRLRNLIETLTRRVSTLEQSNKSIRSAYDKVATQERGGSARQEREVTYHSPNTLSNTQQLGYNTYFNTLLNSWEHSHGFSGRDTEWKSEFDALEMDRYSDLHLLSQEVMETIVQIQEVTSDIGLAIDDTDLSARELNTTAKQLQTNLTRVRMRPFQELVGRFSRALRDLSLQYGKLVELKVYGKGTLIDRSILEAMTDPLMHLVRNAFDHGIEDPATRQAQGKSPQGLIEIKAAHRGNQIIITISDDGNGINLDKIRARALTMGLDAELLAAASEDELLSLIFEPGFSTADEVTDLSGRGVGMDVVRNNLSLVHGDIRVDTGSQRGTTFTLTVPFTLSVARVLLVESNGMLLAFPIEGIEEMLLLDSEIVVTSPHYSVLNWQGEMVPLTRLGEWLTFYCHRCSSRSDCEGEPLFHEPTVLMISSYEHLHGIQVDRIWGEREVAIRKPEGTYTLPPGLSSTCILGSGKVVPLVDAPSLLRWIAQESNLESRHPRFLDNRSSTHERKIPTREEEARGLSCGEWGEKFPPAPRSHAPQSLPPGAPVRQKDTILVVDDSINVRRFLALALEKAGYLVEQAKDGQDAVEKLLSSNFIVSAVLCDIEMPRLDGYGFLARVKSDPTYERLPIAMLTSRSGEKHRQLAMTLGAAAYFSKPYNERELLITLKQVITESRAKKPIHAGVGSQ